jgi:hypothetical protein
MRRALLEAFTAYIDEETIPSFEEFCYLHKVHRQRLYEWEEFEEAREMLVCKKISNLEKGGLTRAIDSGMARISLGQLGWSEKQEIEHTGKGGGPIVVKYDKAFEGI